MAPVLLVALRLLQGLALGGEYGGAATYVAEHAPSNGRGYATSWIQTTATLGFFLSLLVIGLSRGFIDADTFKQWGWRIPFLVSLILLIFSVYIRLKLNESPVFQQMKAEGRGSKRPLTESFLHYPNNKLVLLALLGATAGQGVVWYTGQFYALFFLQITLKVDYLLAYQLIGLSLLIGTPFFIFFGWLSDRIGRLKIILAGCAIAALTYFPIFKALTHNVNPALEQFQASVPISVAADDCNFHIFVFPGTNFTACDRAKDFLTKSGLSFQSMPGIPGEPVVTKIGDIELKGWDQAQFAEALKSIGLSGQGGPGGNQFPDDAAAPGHPADLRDHGLRTDRGLPGRIVPDQDPLHLDVAALSHRQRLVRWDAATAGDRHGGREREHLHGSLVPDRRRGDDPGDRRIVPA